MAYNDSYMIMAIDSAEKGRGLSSPNPFVGAIIVKNDSIIGQGFTQKAGSDHAEIVALKQAGENAKDADLYVTLEPCCHYGKTPPCTDAIIKAGIKNVYAGITDPNPLVSGKGFKLLSEAGINVESGFHKEEIEKQLEYFITWKTKNRPFVIMKNAVSLDGKTATKTGDSKWITNSESRAEVHRLRAQVDAIITGINTVKADDPLLTPRGTRTLRYPVRIILDPFLEIPIDCLILETADQYPTLIIKSDEYQCTGKEEYLQDCYCEILSAPCKAGFLDLNFILKYLAEQNISSLLVETGKILSTSFMRQKLVDKIYYFIAPKILGGLNTVFEELNIEKMDEAIQLRVDSVNNLDNDIMMIAYVADNR
jgi:diaminohydroxyphosphoribosylaminopyrimidine deaminase/5-amino-6-(5-phosphoribosylamino)uracil reductase